MIQPWMFTYEENGETKTDPFKKRTLLWLKNLPHLAPQIFTEPTDVKRWVNAGKKVCGKRVQDDSPASSALMRSKTFKSVAYQIVEQWSRYLEDEFQNAESHEISDNTFNGHAQTVESQEGAAQ